MMMRNRIGLVVAVLMALSVLAGCAPRQDSPDTDSGLSVETTPSPGIVRLEEDDLKAVGTLVYVRKTQTFALVDAGPEKSLTGNERLIARVSEGTDRNVDLVGLVGGYVELSGTAEEPTGTALPEISIESIRIISLPSER